MRLIDADALMRDIEQYHLSDGKFQHWVEVQQTVDAVPVRHGKWVWNDYGGVGNYHCSECLKICNERHDYCPSCGARMDTDDK